MFNCTKFEITEDDLKKIAVWDDLKTGHKCSIKPDSTFSPNYKYVGAIGGHLSITFCPNSIGMSTVVNCSCGEKLDLTDVSQW